MRYNPSSLYRDFVLDLAKAIKKKHRAGKKGK
jgi:membrane-bound lytic murein transglycosylase B